MKNKIILAVWYVVLTLIPILIGLPFTLIYDKPEVIEVSLVVFGLLELLAFNIRNGLSDRKLYKKKIMKEDWKKTEEYRQFVQIRTMLIISGIINLSLSFIYFYIFVSSK